MNKTIDVYFDVGSPASYLAGTQLSTLAERNNASINWKPILLGGVFKVTGNQLPSQSPQKDATQLSTLCALQRSMTFSSNSTRTFRSIPCS